MRRLRKLHRQKYAINVEGAVVKAELEVTKKGFTLWVFEDYQGHTCKHWILDASCLTDEGHVTAAKISEGNWDIGFVARKNPRWMQAYLDLEKKSRRQAQRRERGHRGLEH